MENIPTLFTIFEYTFQAYLVYKILGTQDTIGPFIETEPNFSEGESMVIYSDDYEELK